MNINSLLGNNTTGLIGNGTSSSQATGAVSTVSPGLLKADQRIQSDLDSTTTQLSSFGLLKSAVSVSQSAAQTLTGISSTATASDVTTATANFFNAFNAAITAANATSAVPGTTAAWQSAGRINRDMKWALTSDSTTQDAMKKIGLSVQSDGTLVQDAKKFSTALSSDPVGVRSALATIGKKVDSVTDRKSVV